MGGTHSPLLSRLAADLELVHWKELDYPCGAPSWNRKCTSRLEIMDTGQIPATGSLIKMCFCSWQASWTTFNQHVCFQDECPTSTILQLETRPSSCNSRCSLNLGIKGHHPYTFPPFVLIPCCVSKLLEEVTATSIAPVWLSLIWFPQLLKSLIDLPILFLNTTKTKL